MLFSLSTTHRPATDLGYLLAKRPGRTQSFDVGFGAVHITWPEATDERATMAMLLDIDPIGLVRGKAGQHQDGPLAAYVNDRPYVSSSFFSVALSKVLSSAMNGNCRDRAQLVEVAIPLTAELHVVSCKGGAHLIEQMFGPLDFQIEATRLPRDSEHPEWGESSLYTLKLSATKTLSTFLRQLYVLLPVLDDAKHYWVGENEVQKLLDKGEGWLEGHPRKALITKRYLKHRRGLANQALRQLVDEKAEPLEDIQRDVGERAHEKPLKLNEVRLKAVVELLTQTGARRVLDLGCGEGKLVERLLKVPQFNEIVGVEVSARALEVAERRMDRHNVPLNWQHRHKLIHGSLTYRDSRLDGYDAAAVVEVIEHIDEERLDAFAAALFGGARPRVVVLTTPNVSYNELFESLSAGKMRHSDHRFEWTRAQFQDWCVWVCEKYGYTATFHPIGPVHETLGAPTQMGVLTQCPS